MNRFTSMSALLDQLSPDLPARGPGWDDVLARSDLLATAGTSNGTAATARYRSNESRPSGRLARGVRLTRRRVVLAVAALAAVSIPLLALAAANDWWFFQFPWTPRPVGKPLVVMHGSWNGQAWRLVAYNSRGQGTCWSITFANPHRGGAGVASPGVGVAAADGALGCGGIIGLRPPNKNASGFPTIMWMTGYSFNTGYPAWMAGPVVAKAKTVVIRYRNGKLVRVPTSDRVQLGKVGWYGPLRFFAAQIPEGIHPGEIQGIPQSVTGLDARGKVVACLVPATATQGSYGTVSPLADCKR
jgi:hypothetical protein